MMNFYDKFVLSESNATSPISYNNNIATCYQGLWNRAKIHAPSPLFRTVWIRHLGCNFEHTKGAFLTVLNIAHVMKV